MSECAPYALALHGGAGARRGKDYDRQLDHMRACIETGGARLAAGAPALEVVVEVVTALEQAGLYVAGRGAAPNTEGLYELDASLMDGPSQRAGAVAALRGFKSPIAAARAVMEHTPHVLLAGDGAAAFAREQALDAIGDETTWFLGPEAARGLASSATPGHGTVGCVALDRDGRLAAATSTGGTIGKRPGRVGDSPLIGAGTWADGDAAVSCTGVGEYFIRTACAAQIALRVRLAGQDLGIAAALTLAEVIALGGEGGLIAIGRDGTIAMPFSTDGMNRAALHPDGRIEVAVF